MIIHSKSVSQNAKEIWEGGACNPRAMIRELVKVVDEACSQKGSRGPSDSAEFRLIMNQLIFILFGTDPYQVFLYRDKQTDEFKTHEPEWDIEFVIEKLSGSKHSLVKMILEAEKEGRSKYGYAEENIQDN